MNKRIFFCAVAAIGMLHGEDPFDLKTYERSLKRYIPWSLTGSAQDLRSDAKNQLQLIVRAFILLRPEAPWTDEQKPSDAFISDGIKGLKVYLAEPNNGRKKPLVIDSMNYIINNYVPEVQKLLESADIATLSDEKRALLEQKKQLFKVYLEAVKAGYAELIGNDSDRKVADA